MLSKTLDQYWVRGKREVKNSFWFSWKSRHNQINNLIILMIPFFKNIVRNSLTFQTGHTIEWCWPFWSSTFTFVLCHIHGKVWNISTHFSTQTNKIDDNTNERYASVSGKAGSLIYVSCDVMNRDTGGPAENTENGRCVHAVWDNLKSRLLITDLSNNRSFGREGSLNRVSFDFIRRT